MEQLSKCVEALKDVRRTMQDDADPCILAALDEVIAKFQRGLAEDIPAGPTMAQAVSEALAVLSAILTCVTGIAELLKLFSE